jgi:hypothetical protein
MKMKNFQFLKWKNKLYRDIINFLFIAKPIFVYDGAIFAEGRQHYVLTAFLFLFVRGKKKDLKANVIL